MRRLRRSPTKRLDVCLLSDQGELVDELAAVPDASGLKALADRVGEHREPVCAVIGSMTGARFVHEPTRRIHTALMSFGRPCPVADLFGVEGRELLGRLEIPQPWRGNIDASVHLIDCLEAQIAEINAEVRSGGANHPYLAKLLTVPGIGWILAFTIAAEIGGIGRFETRLANRNERSSRDRAGL